MVRQITFVASFTLFLVQSIVFAVEPFKIVTTIKPLYGLAAGVMQGVGEPIQLLPDYISPHGAQLKPSQIKTVTEADLIFWVGADLETFIEKLLKEPKKNTYALMEIEDIRLLKPRHGEELEGKAHHHHHNHGKYDPHIWLSPENAMLIVDFMAQRLSELDVKNAVIYANNAKNLKSKILEQKQETYQKLHEKSKQPFIVFHDAYYYFENSFDYFASGVMSLNPELPLSGKTLYNLKKEIKNKSIQCAFTEPEFADLPIEKGLKGLNLKFAQLDPLGANISAGPTHYLELLQNIGETLAGCGAEAVE